MEKMKFKVPSWDEGRTLMNEISKKFNIPVEERDADLFGENDTMSVSCHFDDRGFSFFLIKYSNPSLKKELENLITP